MEIIEPYSVIIIGAGLSGLSAANYLCNNGNVSITILEAKGKPGGRIQSRKLSSNQKGVLELGAQWIHGDHGTFFKQIKDSGHIHDQTSWEGKGNFLTPTGQKVDDDIVREICEWADTRLTEIENNINIESLYDNPMKWGHDSSMGSYLREEFDMYMHGKLISEGEKVYEAKVAVFQWIMSFQRIDNSCNQMSDLSLFRWGEFEQNPGEHYNNFKTGAQSFVDDVLVEGLRGKERVSIHYNSPVTKIHWNENGNHEKTIVRVTSGETFYCDCVLVTCSVGVLKATHKTLFQPKLPFDISTSLEATGFGPLTKIFLEWDYAWWPKDLKGYQLLWPKEFLNCCDDKPEITNETSSLAKNWPKSITGFDPVLDCPNALLAWLGGPEAVYVETLDEEEVGQKCTEVLQNFTKLTVPKPKNVIVTKWNSDEYVRGAYSYRATEGDLIIEDIASILSEPIVRNDSNGKEWPVVMFAGEALHKTHYSTMHGAYESGESQAQKLLSYLTDAEEDAAELKQTISSNSSLQITMSMPNSNTVSPDSPSICLQKPSTKVC